MSLDAKTPGETIGPSGRSKPAEGTLAPGLYVVATPIGNLADITLRALAVLGAADLIACEDTRVSAKLLSRHGVATKRLAYHDHNADRVRPLLIERLARAPPSRSSPTPARRSSPTPATSWCARRSRAASPSRPCPARRRR